MLAETAKTIAWIFKVREEACVFDSKIASFRTRLSPKVQGSTFRFVRDSRSCFQCDICFSHLKVHETGANSPKSDTLC